MVILIPAYEPGERLIELIESINRARIAQHLVIVDDGSGASHAPIFDHAVRLGATVLRYPGAGASVNRGKGVALKFGLARIAEAFPDEPIVSADCDGQHTVNDIAKVADALATGTAPLVLGSRAFTGAVPLRSRFGNVATRLVFAVATRSPIGDTQTGLRAFRPELHDWLQSIDGDRFEYELHMLLRAKRDGVEIVEVPIETIYLDQNASSHFRPLVDSARVYWPIVKYSVSSLAAFAVDFGVLFATMALTHRLLLSVVAARTISASFNFVCNRNLVFGRDDGPWRPAAARYGSLVLALLSANYVVLRVLTSLGLGLAIAKVITEATLFTVAYQVQRRVVFEPRALDQSRASTSERKITAAS